MQKTVLVLIDGLSAAAVPCMGWLAAMTAAGRARHACMPCALPPLSRPLYQCILAGQQPVDSGIIANDIPRSFREVPSIFHMVAADGGVTAAAAYHWISELYNNAPYIPEAHRFTDDTRLPVQHGIFYSEDAYPDSHVLLDAESLRRRWNPDFLLVHTMGVDNAGHLFGGESAAYRRAVRAIDGLLAHAVPRWLDAGCAVWITSDHGMHADGEHNDLTDSVCTVPVWGLGITVPLPQTQAEWPACLRATLALPL